MATMARAYASTMLPMREISSDAEAYALLDSAAHSLLGISGDEFMKRWKTGGFGDDPDDIPGVMEVASLIPNLVE